MKKGGSADEMSAMSDEAFVSIGVASPDVIRGWSHGEVKTPDTINYRTYKPDKGGLFCEKIFGPVKDYECSCGKYKRIKHKGVICEKCGVEVTQSRVRRSRMGHIELAVPVSHIWFYKCAPSRLGLMLNMPQKHLDEVLYYEKYVVLNAGGAPDVREGEVIDAMRYEECVRDYPEFRAGMGAEAIQERLKAIDLDKEEARLKESQATTKSAQGRNTIIKRIRLIQGFKKNKMRPEWMVLDVLPVIPPDLRPLVSLDGGRFATSDLTDLYRRVISRNNRLKSLKELNTPEVIIRNEKRMLQEAVDALLDNGRHGRPVTGTGNRPLRSLTDMLKGKQGRFRQNLLGKRVDYSGRSVIVVGPELNIHQCGLPKEMAMRLFEPFIIRRLQDLGVVRTIRNAKKMIDRREKVVWDILEEVVSGHPVMLNRAPTLHRLSIQAFDPILIDGQAIRLHPLVCAAFNADFDGDQMAVHVPLSNEAQLEAKLIMLSANNIFSPANGRPLTIPSHDMVLGVYYLCYEDVDRKQAFLDLPSYKQPYYSDLAEVLRAMEVHQLADEMSHNSRKPNHTGLGIHDFINFKNPYYRSPEEEKRIAALPADSAERKAIEAADRKMVWGRELRSQKFIQTTPGRCIYHEIWPEELGFWNKKAVKKDIQNMIKQCSEHCGHDALLTLLDRLKNLGYSWATRAGFSIAIDDMLIPENKQELIKKAEEFVAKKRKEHVDGALTDKERFSLTVDQWRNTRNEIKEALKVTLEKNRGRQEINPVWAMMDSGARGSEDQVTQVGGMRGLMANANNDILDTPIIHNFREGLTGLEYFNSTHGSRKGLADTALKTADAGYMTRRLVDVAHDVICTCEDCGTTNGIDVEAIRDGSKEMMKLSDRIVGRFAAADIYGKDGNLLVAAGEEITPTVAAEISSMGSGMSHVRIRSVLTCEAKQGICAKCYGRNLATGELPLEGDALGIIAAQSIGEPGTQLTLRTFHTGGTASGAGASNKIVCKWDHLLPELQNKVTRLEEQAKRSGWSDDRLAKERGKLLETENIGFLFFENTETIVRKSDKAVIVISHDAHAKILGVSFMRDRKEHNQTELASFDIPYGAELKVKERDVKNGAYVVPNQEIAKMDSTSTPIIAKEDGILEFRDLVTGVTMKREKNSETSKSEYIVQPYPGDTHPALRIVDADDTTTVLQTEELSEGARIMAEDRVEVHTGDTIARTPKTQAKSSDITTGLPRVAELFEARRPRDAAAIADTSGVVTVSQSKSNKVTVTIEDLETGEKGDAIPILTGKHLIVKTGDFVNAGDPLTEGAPVLTDYLHICGPDKLRTKLVDSVQRVYLSQGGDINDKHIESIVRQMLRKVRIKEAHDSSFLAGEMVDERTLREESSALTAAGKTPADVEPILQGITKASLATESFISAASFQDTPRVLTEAATEGKKDRLEGFKENVIMGHLIPAGTGYCKVQKPELFSVDEDGSVHEITGEGRHVVSPGRDDFDDDFPQSETAIDEADLAENGLGITTQKRGRGGSTTDLLDALR